MSLSAQSYRLSDNWENDKKVQHGLVYSVLAASQIKCYIGREMFTSQCNVCKKVSAELDLEKSKRTGKCRQILTQVDYTANSFY